MRTFADKITLLQLRAADGLFCFVFIFFILNDETVGVIKMFTLLGINCFRNEREDVGLCPPGGDISIKASKHREGKINREQQL